MRWIIREATALALVVALGRAIGVGAPDPLLDEYRVKAAFLFNFAKFVQWPLDVFQNPDEPMSFCILGPDPFGHSLEDTISGHLIQGRTIIVRYIYRVSEAPGCQLLFITSGANIQFRSALAEFKAIGVLTVGESDTSIENGLVINFLIEGSKVRFEINVETAEREKLRISSRLLSLARIIRTSKR